MDEQKNEGKNKTTLYCSFCGKSQHEVKKLIAGPTVFICDECVELFLVFSAKFSAPRILSGCWVLGPRIFYYWNRMF